MIKLKLFFSFSFLNATIYILSLFCGIFPYSAVFKTLYTILPSYPASDNLSKIILNVLPLSCPTKFFTFSKNITLGFLSFIILSISKNRSPVFSSSNPFLYPATEKDVQGNPAINISNSGISSILTSLISLISTLCDIFSSYVLAAFSSYSFA